MCTQTTSTKDENPKSEQTAKSPLAGDQAEEYYLCKFLAGHELWKAPVRVFRMQLSFIL